ncbi:MogA/MoaB family molybdenum cofactor biosynthesis protein [Halovivax limisalsi]|uniref:MogA/MoaB family molybdenum cofactor biosynthesis protein n=1 Tax=Halovivax limisalsi TaxID=1453760 RepID=UPI001FFCBF0E|nr:molybdopterin-binding protein [Halovivax limisalsi]
MAADRADGGTESSDADAAADGGPPLGIGLLSISEMRSLSDDRALAEATADVEAAGHEIVVRERIGRDFDSVQSTASRLADRDDVDALVTVGATSVEPTDVTVGAVRPLLDAELPAFETLFTLFALESIGTHVVASRPLAGVIGETPVFCLPGNTGGTRLAMRRIVCPQLRQLVNLAARPEADDGDESEADE